MAASTQATDRILPTESTESLEILTPDTEEKPTDSKDEKEQPLSTKGEQMVPSDVSLDATTMGASRDVMGQPGSLEASGECNAFNPPNVYAPQAFYYGGYESTSGEWDEYPQYVNAEGVEIGSPGVYNENPSVLYHPPYGYNAQMPYGPYSPVTTPLPSVRGDGQLYLPPQQFPFTGTYYHQPVPLSMPYITPPSPVPQTDLSMPAGIDQQGAFVADTSNSNSMLFGPRPGYPLPYGSFGRGSFGGSTGSPGYYDLRQGFDGFGSSEPWSDWSKSSDGQQRSFSPLSSQTASPQPIAFGSFGHNVAPLSPANTSQQQRPLYGIGSMTSSYNRSYPHSGIYHQGSNFGRSTPGLATNGRSWIAVDKGRRRGRGAGSLCSCNGTLDVLSEQNRGPRASRPKSQQTEHNSSSVDGKKERSIGGDNCEYNRPDFVTEYRDAKFFIIKSYSEDNVHKSIKYGVWASTPNGNRKLDAAYHEAKEQEGPCPVFLLFSVNASAQFCGVAEMMGPVDFDKSVDYWQQDKWSGQFPVKWHIIKDVPNSQFRHIILENNDNKPVTNSRDTQEVKLIKGIEILNIFKDYDSDLSILDDFEYYEGRQKLMQERKARQQASLTNPATASTEHKNPAAVSGEFIKQMSKSFANAVRLDEGKEAPATEKGGAPGKDLTPPTLQSN